jgi:hypothetical protein
MITRSENQEERRRIIARSERQWVRALDDGRLRDISKYICFETSSYI